MAISGAYFDVMLIGPGAVLAGGFTSVSGLDMEVDYDVYTEGGSSYPRFFSKQSSPRAWCWSGASSPRWTAFRC